MKFLNKETKTVLDVNDEKRIEKFKGYPDKFTILEDTKEIVEDTKENIEDEKVNISKMKKEDLLALAKERGIEIVEGTKVDDMRKILKEAENKVEE